MDRVAWFAAASIVIGAVVLVMKYVAYRLTGSIALYSDALESVINLVTAFVALYAVRIAAKPADAQHPYGHQKAEYFSAVFVGVLIVVAALAILRDAYFAFLSPKPIENSWLGLGVNAGAAVINAIWSTVLIRASRRFGSPALLADGRHLFTDVLTSVAVIGGVCLAIATGWNELDPALAVVVAANILWTGWSVVKDSVGGLMDQSVPADALERIRKAISINADGAIEAHDLRTRQAGRTTFVDFHLVVPSDMRVSDAHEICDRLERALRSELHEAQITIHVEPDDKAKHTGVLVL